MKIIEIGTCIDNKDPRGFGRIRCSDTSESDGARANAVPSYEQWSKDDPFVYSPFLPNHINIIPQINQVVKLIRYDDEKTLQNQEYIPGPYTTPHNFAHQNELSQLTETSLGQRGVKTPDIKSFTGDKKVFDDGFLRPESVGSLPKLDDIAISGNYGSDVILTEHGVILRAGKLIDKFTATKSQREDLELYPMYSKKHSKISLKKYPTTLKLTSKVIEDTFIPRTDIKHVFEYNVNSLTNPTQVLFKIFRIDRAEGEKYKTDVFNLNTTLGSETSVLIHTETITLESGNASERYKEAYIQIRDLISRLDRENMKNLNSSLPDTTPHPFYFRPDTNLRNQANSDDFLDNVVYLKKTNGYGLIYSKDSEDIQPQVKKVDVPFLKKISDVDQTFAAITADHVLHLSTTSSGVDGKQVDFGALDKYEYTQEDYLMRILPNTFSTVRGEKLIEILDLMTLILLNHTHGIITPPKYFKASIDQLKSLIAKAKQDLVNSSIRIN